ncbi:2,3-diketo-5-methylthiopentyl-1-phosphate enolase [Bacillus sp. NRRL B-14911]|nr:2,3-diketo-5-methylthiopentyl-1-phosphate enolase [Bacillus sp. NRRL B-14911]
MVMLIAVLSPANSYDKKNRINKKDPFRKKRSELCPTSSHLSAQTLQELAPCFLQSRLPGFIGLVPPPALDKKTKSMWNLKFSDNQ